MISKVHAIIHVDSRGRNEGLSKSKTDFLYELTQPINFYKRSENKQYFIRVENVKVPVSFYNISSNYNTINFTSVTDGAQTITLTPGNYTIDELIAELETQMNAVLTTVIDITYSEFTQKVSISTATEALTSVSGSLLDIIGFTGVSTIATGGVEAPFVAYTNTASNLKLMISNIVSNNVYSNSIVSGQFKQTNLQNVSLMIPVKEIRNEFVFFDNHTGPMIKLPNISSVKNINVRLVDMYNNTVDLNGLFFTFDLVIYEYNKNPLFTNM